MYFRTLEHYFSTIRPPCVLVQTPVHIHTIPLNITPYIKCRLRLETLQRQKQFQGQQVTCSSVERVLQCLPGCSPVRTTPITVGFNCQQAGDSEVTSVHNHSADLMETVQAHLGCSCNAQCA
uniref:Uncharacterized protein n=1 Tax=Sphaeramia orbicularis TaxID=375764 RepID=A0A673A409_9TELE